MYNYIKGPKDEDNAIVRCCGVCALVLLGILLGACGQKSPQLKENWPWQKIAGRDEGGSSDRLLRHPVYQARVPLEWRREDPTPEQSIVDSTLPLVEFFIESAENEVRITVHNFPTNSLNERIPPAAQVARWKRQLGLLSPQGTQEIPQAHGGFAGIYFQAEGVLEGQNTRVLAWSMLLAPEHYRSLEALEGNAEELAYYRQMRADYTIKAVGAPQAITRHQAAIERFARSFELIQVIPTTPL